MPTRIVNLTDDAFVILEDALKRAGLAMGIPKTCRPIAYDRVSRELVVEDPRYDRDEGRNVVAEAQASVAAKDGVLDAALKAVVAPEPPGAAALSGVMHLDHPAEECVERACPPEHAVDVDGQDEGEPGA